MGRKHLEFLAFIFMLLFLSISFISAQDNAVQNAVEKEVILYVFLDSKDNYQIGIMGVSGENKQALTKNGNNWAPTISNDGKSILFYSDRSGFANLWKMNIYGRQQIQMTDDNENIVKIDLYNRGQIAGLKDGSILFLKKNDIWQINNNGENPSNITNYHDVNGFKISPDKMQILFSREKTVKHNGLFVVLINKTDERQIEKSVIINPVFDWGSNNSIVYFKNSAILIMAGNGTQKRIIKSVYYFDNYLEWAKKDDKPGLIAYIDDRNDGPNIWVMDKEGKQIKQITKTGSFSPCWMADGKTLLFVQGFDIYKKNIETNDKKRLTYHFKSFYPSYGKINTQKTVEKKGRAEDKYGEEIK